MPTTVLTCGVFDLCHRGHILHLRACREHGDRLVVAVQEGGAPPAKTLPVMYLRERIATVEALGIADRVVSYASGLDGEIVRHVKPDVMCVGPDWFDHDRSRVLEALEECGGRVVVIPRTPGVSTTEIRRRAALTTNPKPQRRDPAQAC